MIHAAPVADKRSVNYKDMAVDLFAQKNDFSLSSLVFIS
jgi:hypothetical protein